MACRLLANRCRLRDASPRGKGPTVSVYEDRLSEVRADERLMAVSEAVGKLATEHRGTIGGAHEGLPDRAAAAAEYMLTRLELTDALVIPTPAVSELESAVSQLVETSQSAAESPDATSLNALESAVDALLAVATRWPVRRPDDVGDALFQAAESYRRSLGQRTASLWTQFDELVSRLNELRAAAESQSDNIQESTAAVTSRLTELGNRLDELERQANAKLEELQSQISSDKQRLDEAIARYEKQFSESQSSRTEKFDELVASARSGRENMEEELRTVADDLVGEIREQLAAAKDLVGVIAASGVTHEFNKEALAQKEQADRWRRTAVVLSLGAVAGVGWAVATTTTGNPPVMATVAKLVGSLVFFGIAGYAANQSARHRDREEVARSLEMDLVAFGPFIQDLAPETQQRLREELVAKVFGRSAGLATSSPDSLTSENVTLIGHLFEQLQKLPKLGGQ